MATIKVRQNGPYLVEGDDVTVVDWNGNSYQIAKRPFALCRCGGRRPSRSARAHSRTTSGGGTRWRAAGTSPPGNLVI
jgi:hypothetical protein